tara:strand:- start:640 stop:1197 length:558 start_codon:yes stop_codon:yes gene_type:complete
MSLGPAKKKSKVSSEEESSEKWEMSCKELGERFDNCFEKFGTGVFFDVISFTSKITDFNERYLWQGRRIIHFTNKFEIETRTLFEEVTGEVNITFGKNKNGDFVTSLYDTNDIALSYVLDKNWSGHKSRWNAHDFKMLFEKFIKNYLIEYICRLLFNERRELYDKATCVLHKHVIVKHLKSTISS